MLLATNFFRVLALAFPTAPVILTIIGIVAVTTFVVLSKSQKVQERAFVRKVKKVKQKQKAYKNEKDQTKIEKRVKQYNKSLKNLEKRIRYALWWNRKKIVLTNPILTNETSESDLAISGTPFTFKNVLNKEISSKAKNKKKTTQVIEKNKTIKQLKAEPVVTQLNEPQKNLKTVKYFQQVSGNNNFESIYKSKTDEKIK